MPSKEVTKVWHEAMIEVIDSSRAKLSVLGIPVIDGTIRGSGHTLISCESCFLETHEPLLRQENCLAVIDVEYSGEVKEGSEIRGVAIHVRLGATNSWLYYELSLTSEDDDLEDDLDEELEPEVDSAVLTALALTTARSAEFGKLKNKAQRQEFVLNLLGKEEHRVVSGYHSAEIVHRAESIYEFGILPEQVRQLSSQGKSLLEISKALGLTKQKVERALLTQTPDFITEMMK